MPYRISLCVREVTKALKSPPPIIINRKGSTHFLKKVSAKEKQETPEEMKWEVTTEQAATSLSSPPQKPRR